MMLDLNKGYWITTTSDNNNIRLPHIPKVSRFVGGTTFEGGGAEDRNAVRGPMVAKPDPELPLKASIGRRPAAARTEVADPTAVSGGNADTRMDASARHCGLTGQGARVGQSDSLGSPGDPGHRMNSEECEKEKRKKLRQDRPMAVICGVASFLASASMTPTICEYGDRVSADWRTFQTAFMTCHAAAPIVKAWSFNTGAKHEGDADSQCGVDDSRDRGGTPARIVSQSRR